MEIQCVIITMHTLLLSWLSHIFPIISELIIANENQKDSRIALGYLSFDNF